MQCHFWRFRFIRRVIRRVVSSWTNDLYHLRNQLDPTLKHIHQPPVTKLPTAEFLPEHHWFSPPPSPSLALCSLFSPLPWSAAAASVALVALKGWGLGVGREACVVLDPPAAQMQLSWGQNRIPLVSWCTDPPLGWVSLKLAWKLSITKKVLNQLVVAPSKTFTATANVTA